MHSEKHEKPPESNVSLLTKIEGPVIAGKIDLSKIDSSTKPKKKSPRYCCYCKQTIPKINFTHEHLIPLSKGGNNSFYNKKSCCLGCNRERGNKCLEKWLLEIKNDLKNGRRKAKSKAIIESIPHWIGYIKKHEIKMRKKRNTTLCKTNSKEEIS